MSLNERSPDRHRRTVDSGEMHAAPAGVTDGAAAGCTSVTDRAFGAQPVALSQDGRQAPVPPGPVEGVSSEEP